MHHCAREVQRAAKRAPYPIGTTPNPYTSGNVELLLTYCRMQSGVAAKAVGAWRYVAEHLQAVPGVTGKGAAGNPKGEQRARPQAAVCRHVRPEWGHSECPTHLHDGRER